MRDKVEILAGNLMTPNTMAVADVSAQAKKFMVAMNAATSVVITKSPYMVRTSFTAWQVNEALGAWAYKNGVRKAYTLVCDYGPGWDGEAAFSKGFKDAGGEIIGGARYPVTNQDFSAFIQRAKDANPDGIYIWVPGGTQPACVRPPTLPSRPAGPPPGHIETCRAVQQPRSFGRERGTPHDLLYVDWHTRSGLERLRARPSAEIQLERRRPGRHPAR